MTKKEFYGIVVTLYTVATAWLILSYFLKGTEGGLCPLKLMFSVPCPFCGLTHACQYLLEGWWMRALQSNPLVVFFPAAVGALPLIAHDILRNRLVVYHFTLRLAKRHNTRVALLAMLLLVWAYKLILHFCFV